MAIHKTSDGVFAISSHQVWRPGAYEDERAARFAFRFGDETLQKLQDAANARAGATGGVITWGDLAQASDAARKTPNVGAERQ